MKTALRFSLVLLLTAGLAGHSRAQDTETDASVSAPETTQDASNPQEQYLQRVKVEFNLVNSDGKHVTQKDFLGKYVLLTFGYTHCEHICPTILNDMAHTLKASGRDMAGIFISVDTERDTPRRTNEYASGFYQKITGLSGSYREVKEAANNFNVRYSVTKTQNHYMVQHSSDIFYIGPDGKLLHVYSFNTLPHDLDK